ncbi:YciI family protein [Rhodopirellula sp. MGV]|uniref:YciI family protein n=1 Tax=Rhodopirellula sp. MGV TaxID=2023130 RepID=UPI000B96B6FD|nr:YciI family protein [Rhodopirellula sp. MGV]OYP33051.1 dehydrogenase [Rhodopirellula sp. MGV]PNY35366.1 dehydrogenase [Rhodopirellula baltica]
MKFVCLGYIDEKKFAEVPPEEGKRMMEACFEYDDELRLGGHFLGGEALGWSQKAVTLHNVNGEIEAVDGPFAETKEVLGGILLLEANNMEHAIELMSKHPGVRVGPFEIRPADEEINALIRQRDAAVAAE